MRLTFLLVSLALAGCLRSPPEAKTGARVKVIDGFYKSCTGVVKGVLLAGAPCRDKVLVAFDTCAPLDIVSYCELEVIRE